MRGLIYKDFTTLMGVYKKNLILVLVLYGAMAVMMNNHFFIYFAIWMMGFYGLTGFSLDTQCGWDRYARTLPVQDWKIVAAKYIAGLLFVGIGVAYSVVIGVVCWAIDSASAASLGEMMFTVGLVTATAVACVAVMYFLAIKFSPDKARNYFMMFFMAVFFGFFLLYKGGAIGELPSGKVETMVSWLDHHVALTVLGMLAVSAVVLLLSMAAACAVYRRKEF